MLYRYKKKTEEITPVSVEKLLSDYVGLTDSVILVEAFRPMYTVDASIEKCQKAGNLLHDLSVAKDNFSLNFYCYANEADKALLMDLLITLWFEYEEPRFFFLTQQGKSAMDLITRNDDSWYCNFEKNEGYFIYHTGFEESIMWVKKSISLKFPDWYL